MLHLRGVGLMAGERELLEPLDFTLLPNDRLGLVGRNGAGKSTLLRAIAGLQDTASGKVELQNGLRLGYLPQDAVSGSQKTVWDEVREGLGHILDLERALLAATEAMDGSPERIAAHAAAEDAYRQAGGYAADKIVGGTLWGLGFAPSDWTRSCAEFSGGWQMRIALARLLVSNPDILLLDEPTNHLDMHARSYLARRLAEHEGALLLVSHDRFVLDRCVTAVVELRDAGLDRYTGNFTSFLRLRAERDALLTMTAERQAEEAARLRRFVERFGAKATKAAQAQSRVKRLEKLEAQAVELPKAQEVARLRLQAGERASGVLMSLRGASIGYTTPLAKNLEMELCAGERWAVLGANGAGKTTLIKTLAGVLPLLAGQRHTARGARVGFYEQDQAQALPGDLCGVEVVLERAPFCTEARARGMLGALGLHGDDALRPVRTLSGGEKARVALACLAVMPHDVLLLDEPTNHLDVLTADVLTQAIGEFGGLVVLISHDRHLVERVATHVARFTPEGVIQREGLLPEDLEPPKPPPSLGGAGQTAPAEAASAHKDRQRKLRERERLARELSQAEKKVSELEDKLSVLDRSLSDEADQPARVATLLKQREQAEAALNAAMTRWEELALAVES
ncbi:MAG: ABC-F family ATP-binding cassette domain-containing protein [Deltaproteobacteria bacterium]|nr:ABC-F family ATP-binding cassette domain-containing protein [Deltaproteobacteria bacterium]MBK9643762.1 ABC-F family ATP-binding cassette domain-containing protein [Deltaproteobacteria bacterium]